jgi:hypothetical protein
VLEHLGRLRIANGEYSFVYPLRGVWYLIRGGIVVEAAPAPKTRASVKRAAGAIERVFGGAVETNVKGSVRDLDLLLLVSSWFRQFPKQLDRTMSVAKARDRLAKICKTSTATVPMVAAQTRNPRGKRLQERAPTAKTA